MDGAWLAGASGIANCARIAYVFGSYKTGEGVQVLSKTQWRRGERAQSSWLTASRLVV